MNASKSCFYLHLKMNGDLDIKFLASKKPEKTANRARVDSACFQLKR